jgi:DNA-binding response OmpR family regulator
MNTTAALEMSLEVPSVNPFNFQWGATSLLPASNVRQSILIADSDSSNLKLVSTIVKDEGFKVISARDGREARRILEYGGGHIAAAILEDLLPHVSGPDLVRYMKSEPNLKNIPVIMINRAISVRLSWEGFEAGAAVLVPEPFSVSQIQNLLHMVVDGNPFAKSTAHGIGILRPESKWMSRVWG